MSMENEVEKAKEDKSGELYNSIKELEIEALFKKKTEAVKDLEKKVKQISNSDVSKSSERAKLGKLLDRQVDSIKEALLYIAVIDRAMKEKDF